MVATFLQTRPIHRHCAGCHVARTAERGQILPLALAGVVLTSVVMAMLVNTGNRVTVKTKMAHVADAAALSSATYTAQHLNSMAYLNRAMVANHVGAGHMVAYISWIRYVENVARDINYIATIYPPARTVTTALHRGTNMVTRAGELAAKVYIPAVNELNRFYSLAQDEAYMRFALLNTVNDVMQEVVSQSGDNISLNTADLRGFVTEEATVIRTALAHQRINIGNFTRRYNVTDRGGEINTLVNSSTGESNQRHQGSMSGDFINGRDWDLFIVRKSGEGTQQLHSRSSTWMARDRLQLPVPKGIDFEWVAVASGQARALEFHTSYRGIHSYYGLERHEDAHHVLPIVAAVSTSQSEIYVRSSMGIEDRAGKGGITGLAIAHVEYVRPLNGFSRIQEDEYANMFNPFWTARLIGSSMADMPRAFQRQSSWRGGES